MVAVRRQVLALYVDRCNQQWIVRDHDGNYWILPQGDNPWGARQPFCPTDETELEPVPGHYKHTLGLPI